jgi:hypothetical protein
MTLALSLGVGPKHRGAASVLFYKALKRHGKDGPAMVLRERKKCDSAACQRV